MQQIGHPQSCSCAFAATAELGICSVCRRLSFQPPREWSAAWPMPLRRGES